MAQAPSNHAACGALAPGRARYHGQVGGGLPAWHSGEEKLISQLAAEYDVHPNQRYRWRDVALTGLPRLFSGQSAQEQAAKDAAHAHHLEELYAEIGKLTTQLTWIKKKLPQ